MLTEVQILTFETKFVRDAKLRHVFRLVTVRARQVVPFPQMELQATWVARVLSGRARLPSCADMQAAIDADDAELAARRVPQRCDGG